MKLIILFLLVFISEMALAQTPKITDGQYNQSGAIRIVFVQSEEEATKLAESDIQKGMPFLLLKSGISPVVYPADSSFEENFKVYYYDSGCVGPAIEYAMAYNNRIFLYLTENYGSKWKRKVRKDVLGFRKWKQA